MELRDTLDYYKRQGAPSDQSALISLLAELQQDHGGSIPKYLLAEIAAYYGTKEALLLAIIRRIPRLRLSDTHTLELCAGPNCSKAAALAACAEKLCAETPSLSLKFVPCMRLCGRGPNIRLDGKLYHAVTDEMLTQLVRNL